MYNFVVDFVGLIQTGKIRFFLLFFLIIWLRWLAINAVALFYRPYTTSYRCRKSVIIPVVDENPEVFLRVLKSVKRERPQEIIVIINGPKNRELENVCKKIPGVEYHWTRRSGKRNAIRHGMSFATGEIIVLVDSDTIWAKGCLKELVKPFAEMEVGGVTTRQKISSPTRSILARFCSWLEEIRALGTMQAMSVTGKVGCLPGRTIAFRRSVLKAVMHDFMNESFLGLHKEVSDDRSLTNLTLQVGYKTVMQNTAVVYTEVPDSWRKFCRQQLRWSEGSQYNNVRMSRWMLNNARFMFFIYWTDTILPFMLWGLYGSYILNALFKFHAADNYALFGIQNSWAIFILVIIGAYISYAVRQLHILKEQPGHLVFLPAYILILSFIMAPIRMLGFARLADDLGWGTRGGAYQGAINIRTLRFSNART